MYLQPDAWRTASGYSEQQRVGLASNPPYDSDATPSVDQHIPSSSAVTLPASEYEDECFVRAMRAHEHVLAQRQLEENTDTDDLSSYIAAIDAACSRASAT